MPRKSTYQHYSLTKKQAAKQTFAINKFLGVNYSKNNLEISDAQSVDMKNLIYRDGVIQKRQGWEQVTNIGDKGTINGVYKFNDSNQVTHLIFHIGKYLYECFGIGKQSKYYNVSFTKIVNKEIQNKKSFAFATNHRLYILDGEYYYVLKYINGTYTLTKVQDDPETFIPTTTIGITEKESGISLRTAYDDINLLSPYRINKIITGIKRHDEETLYEYDLDAPIQNSTIDNIADLLSKIEIKATFIKQSTTENSNANS